MSEASETLHVLGLSNGNRRYICVFIWYVRPHFSGVGIT